MPFKLQYENFLVKHRSKGTLITLTNPFTPHCKLSTNKKQGMSPETATSSCLRNASVCSRLKIWGIKYDFSNTILSPAGHFTLFLHSLRLLRHILEANNKQKSYFSPFLPICFVFFFEIPLVMVFLCQATWQWRIHDGIEMEFIS